MATVISNSPEETLQIGERWGRHGPAGRLFALQGDLGAGKTQLVRGLARGLECPARVHSPTFSLIHIYEGGRLLLYHLDLYRLETSAQLESAGLEEYLWKPDGIIVVEWAERWLGTGLPAPPPQALPEGGLRCVWIELMEGNLRRIRYEDFGH